MKKLVNKGRGTAKVPTFKITSQVVEVTGIDPRASTDGSNIIYMTADDRFFIGKSGTAAYMNTWFGSGGSVSMQDGKFTSPNKILEADGFFRSNHFSAAPDTANGISESFNSDFVIVHEFGHAFGFQHSPYTHDYMSYRIQHVNANTLKNKNSIVWQLSGERDKLYYDDTYWDQPRMLPLDGTVIDLTYLHAPGKEDEYVDFNANHPMVVTNLKGVSGKQMSMSIFEGEVQAAPPPAKALFTIKGDSIDYLIRMEQGYPFVKKYRLSLLNFGKDKYWKKISALIDQKGYPETINGVAFSKAVQCTIQITGYLDIDSGQKKSVSAVVWFVKE